MGFLIVSGVYPRDTPFPNRKVAKPPFLDRAGVSRAQQLLLSDADAEIFQDNFNFSNQKSKFQ
jgi:hypothetical protein